MRDWCSALLPDEAHYKKPLSTQWNLSLVGLLLLAVNTQRHSSHYIANIAHNSLVHLPVCRLPGFCSHVQCKVSPCPGLSPPTLRPCWRQTVSCSSSLFSFLIFLCHILPGQYPRIDPLHLATSFPLPSFTLTFISNCTSLLLCLPESHRIFCCAVDSEVRIDCPK